MVETKPESKKKRGKKRVADDDVRRMQEMWAVVNRVIAKHEPQLVVVEHYAPQPGSMGGNSWKTAYAYQLCIAAAFANDIEVWVRRAGDLKREFLGQASGSKDETIAALLPLVDGLGGALQGLAKGKHEHVVDAVGHAYIGLARIQGERHD